MTMRNQPRKSRYYPSDRSWTKTPAWAFEIPLKLIDALRPQDRISLLCQHPKMDDSYLVLEVPVAFLKEQQGSLFVRVNRGSISLFLSATEPTRFMDLRGSGKIDFRRFLVSKQPKSQKAN